MKVYHLESAGIVLPREEFETLGIFDKPKTARKWLDKELGIDSKNKWRKISPRLRTFTHEDLIYFISETK